MSELTELTSRFQAPWQRISAQPMQLGESPRHAHGQLRWVDINARTLHILNIDSLSISNSRISVLPPGIRIMQMPDQIACILPSIDPHCWIGCGRTGIWNIRDDGQHNLMVASPFDSTWQRFNDGCCDQWGRIWISSLIDDKRAPLAKLWCLQRGDLHEVMAGITTGNGLAFSAKHRKLWMADTFAKRIRRFDIDPHNTQLTADGWEHHYANGTERPDGACMIDDEHYAVAVIDGMRLDVFGMHNTEPVCSIPLSASKPTMPCVIPKPAPILAFTSAAMNRDASVSSTESKNADDGFVMGKLISFASDTTHLYSN